MQALTESNETVSDICCGLHFVRSNCFGVGRVYYTERSGKKFFKLSFWCQFNDQCDFFSVLFWHLQNDIQSALYWKFNSQTVASNINGRNAIRK